MFFLALPKNFLTNLALCRLAIAVASGVWLRIKKYISITMTGKANRAKNNMLPKKCIRFIGLKVVCCAINWKELDTFGTAIVAGLGKLVVANAAFGPSTTSIIKSVDSSVLYVFDLGSK